MCGKTGLIGGVLLAIVGSCPSLMVRAADQPWSASRFDDEIAPILISRCLKCHSGADPKGGLSLATRRAALEGGESGAVLILGDSTESLLWQKIASGDMPPDEALPLDQQQHLRRWMEAGAIWGSRSALDPPGQASSRRAGADWWSLQPLRRPSLPALEDGANEIDLFIRRRLRRDNLAPSAPTDPRLLARRLSFDLLGLPPSFAETRRFEAESRVDRERATQSFVDRLLASPHFGERWSRHWLDVARFGESQGFERDKLRVDSWYYRDWVIDAMNADMPYDQFARWQIAGDVLQPKNPDAIKATGFLVAGAYDEVGQSQQSAAMRAVVRQDELEDYVGTVTQSFLGLTANCARCHDHKFDPIRQREYYQLASALSGVRPGHRQLVGPTSEPYTVYAVTPSEAEETRLLLRGNPATPGEVVLPGGVAVVEGADFDLQADAPDADRRAQLAHWIARDDNPLFARVIVNRIWHHHFGVGLVETPNDFGFNGGRPSHPELLDWLASELVDSDWSLKRIHRLIVLSSTYQQASRFRVDCAAVDSDNRLLWRRTPRRLEAEVLRDAILSVSGQLNQQLNGPPYRDFETFNFNSQFYNMIDPVGPEFHRRTIYRTWIRSGRNPLLDAFDCPDPSTTAPSRAVTTTPIQALALMNNSFVIRMAERFADRVTAEIETNPAAQGQLVYSFAFGRSPGAGEIDEATEFIARYGLPAFCRVVVNSNEFVYVD